VTKGWEIKEKFMATDTTEIKAIARYIRMSPLKLVVSLIKSEGDRTVKRLLSWSSCLIEPAIQFLRR
jgi:hypothetical protein